MIAVCVPVVVTADEGLGAATEVTDVFVSAFMMVFADSAAATDIFAVSPVLAARKIVFAVVAASVLGSAQSMDVLLFSVHGDPEWRTPKKSSSDSAASPEPVST